MHWALSTAYSKSFTSFISFLPVPHLAQWALQVILFFVLEYVLELELKTELIKCGQK